MENYDKIFRDDFEKKLIEYNNHSDISDNDVEKLFNKIMDLWTKKEKPVKPEYRLCGNLDESIKTGLWSILNRVVDTSSYLDFAVSLRSFLVNTLMDDSSYKITTEIAYPENYHYEGSKATTRTFLEWGNDDNGRSDIGGIRRLINKMIRERKEYYKRSIERQKQINERNQKQ
jgi:hypothetical protein